MVKQTEPQNSSWRGTHDGVHIDNSILDELRPAQAVGTVVLWPYHFLTFQGLTFSKLIAVCGTRTSQTGYDCEMLW